MEDTEATVLRRLRSVGEFNSKMHEDLLRLFHAPDLATGARRTTDYWLQLPNYWVRMTHAKRTCTVHPDDEPSPIAERSIGDLHTAERCTYIVESQFPDLNGAEVEDLSLHELTHLPFRDWCPHCVKSKGRRGPAKKQSDRQPVIQVDSCFHATSAELPLRKILSACDIQTGLGMAVVVASKGENDYAIAELKKFIYECGRTFGILQYDQESPLKAVCQRVCAELGGLSIRAAPKARSQSMGSIGQMQRTLYGQVRALLSQAEQRLKIEIDSNHALYPWALKHAQWLLNRCLVHSDGRHFVFSPVE